MTDHTPSVLVSIGLPVYNGERYLRESIDSILRQTFRRFELIVCDNASTDDTEVICRSYVNQDERVVYYRNPENMGAAYNYNKAFKHSKGEFFKWAAADDVIAPEFLEACLSVLVNDPRVVLCYPRTVFIDEMGKEIGEYSDEMELIGDTALARYSQFHNRFRKRDKCNAIFGLVRSSALGSTRLIDRFVSSDIVLLGELALLGKIHEVQRPLFFRRDHPQMSIRAYKAAERSAWFDTKRKPDSQTYVHWRLGKEFFRSVWTLPLKFGTRLGCSLEALKWVGWRRHLLWKEGRRWGLTGLRNLPYPISGLLRSFWKLVNRGTEKTPTSGEGV